MKDGLFGPSLRAAWALGVEADVHDINSPVDIVTRTGGLATSKLVTLSAAGDPVATNLFVIAGHIEIIKLYGVFVDVTEVTDIEEVRYDVYDGTVDTAITAAGGVECDGVALNSIIMKVDAVAAALTLLDADQVRVYESSKNDVLNPITINAKNGVTTYLRILHKNTDENLDCQVRTFVEWRHLSSHDQGTVTPV